MNELRQAAEAALEALDRCALLWKHAGGTVTTEAADALRAALITYPQSDAGWLHRIDMVKGDAWEAGYAKGKKAALAEPCGWSQDGDYGWYTECGNRFLLEDGTPAENGMAYCCFCGKPLESVPYEEEDDE